MDIAVVTECKGLATKCCKQACFDVDDTCGLVNWYIKPQKPKPIPQPSYWDCITDCINTLCPPLLNLSCGPLGTAALICDVLEYVTLAELLLLLPAWCGGAITGCLLGCLIIKIEPETT